MVIAEIITGVFTGFMQSPRFLKMAQRVLIVTGVLLLLAFFTASYWPEIKADTTPEEYTFYSIAVSVLTLLLMLNFMLLIAVSAGRINIFSKAEEVVERVRELDFKLKILRFNMDQVADLDEAQELDSEYIALKSERDLLISESPKEWGHDISTDWGKVLVESRKRLLDEDDRLRRSNRVNMKVGIGLAFLGASFPLMYLLYILYVSLFIRGLDSNDFQLPFTTYLPIVSTVFIFEVIAIFFLNLYASNERRVERNKSDLTNIELRLTAGLMAYDEKNKTDFKNIAEIFAQEQCRFILGKNESTEGISANKLLETLLKTASKAGE